MAYKSLYRKYRPSNFEDVYGQKFIIKTLKNAIETSKISHAYLFSGTRGTGKTTIAKIFAKMVNCMNPNNNLLCGKCEICLNENTDEIPDIIEIDAASNNGVDEIRELKNNIKLVPVMCKYKVYIIDEVHMLSTGAFNALLKTLEEPPEHVIFILATTEPQKLPITIVSRCQRFDFKKISKEDIFERLKYISIKENINVEDNALLEIAKMSDGAMRDALSTLDQLNSYSSGIITIDDIYVLKGNVASNVLIELINSYLTRNFEKILDIIEKIDLEGKSFSLIVDEMLMFFRNALISKKASKYFDNKNILLKNEILEVSEKMQINVLENIILKLEGLSKTIKESNYPRILFEIYMLSEFDIINDKQLKNEEFEEVKIEKIKLEPINKKDELNLKKVIEDSMNILTKEKNSINNNNILEPKETLIKLSAQTNDKNVLINNTIALASAKDKKNVQDAFKMLDKYLIENKYRDAATILKDSAIAAASNDHLLLTYKYQSMVECNDNEINIIRELISKILNVEYKVVSITEDEWQEQRPYYLSIKKEKGSIPILEEKIEEQRKINNDELSAVDNLIDIFGSDLIEMEG